MAEKTVAESKTEINFSNEAQTAFEQTLVYVSSPQEDAHKIAQQPRQVSSGNRRLLGTMNNKGEDDDEREDD